MAAGKPVDYPPGDAEGALAERELLQGVPADRQPNRPGVALAAPHCGDQFLRLATRDLRGPGRLQRVDDTFEQHWPVYCEALA